MSDTILLVTVNKIEATTVLDIFSEAARSEWKRQVIQNKIYYPIGQINGMEIYMVQSEAGTSPVGASQSTVSKAIASLKPDYIIMVGVAYGLNPQKQNIGEILVSKKLTSYEPGKAFTGDFLPRGDRISAPMVLLDKFRSGDNDWKGARVHFGLILSGEKLVADANFRSWLLGLEPEAIGGEMEGAGLYVASYEENKNWILVKGISDWGDEHKNDEDQQLAARNASTFVLHVIRNVGWKDGIQEPRDSGKPLHDVGSVLVYQNKILAGIEDLFTEQIQKELIEHMGKYIRDPKLIEQGKSNPFAILYFSHEVEEMSTISMQIFEIYGELKNGYVTDTLVQQLEENLENVSFHKELTSQLVRAALSVEPEHYVGKSIKRALGEVSDAVTAVRVALLDKTNKPDLLYSIFALHQQAISLHGGMNDLCRYLSEFLPS